jgi:hypothetical protein
MAATALVVIQLLSPQRRKVPDVLLRATIVHGVLLLDPPYLFREAR